jgi:hypothetical protein
VNLARTHLSKTDISQTTFNAKPPFGVCGATILAFWCPGQQGVFTRVFVLKLLKNKTLPPILPQNSIKLKHPRDRRVAVPWVGTKTGATDMTCRRTDFQSGRVPGAAVRGGGFFSASFDAHARIPFTSTNLGAGAPLHC